MTTEKTEKLKFERNKKCDDAQRYTDWKYITKTAMAVMTWAMQRFYVAPATLLRVPMVLPVGHPPLSQNKQDKQL